MIKVYSTHCPRCMVIEKKLTQKGLKFEIIDDINMMREMGIQSTPMLQIDDQPLMKFDEANKWVNAQPKQED